VATIVRMELNQYNSELSQPWSKAPVRWDYSCQCQMSFSSLTEPKIDWSQPTTIRWF